LEIRADERLLIIDLGTGVRPLGEWLIKNDLKKYGKIKAEIFVTHTHWDHILGFPMFTPVYIPGTELCITGPVTFENDTLKDIIETQLSYRYWPVRAGELAASIEYKQIKETTMDLGGGLSISTKYLNHPVLCLGYRFDYKGKSIAIVIDHEPFHNLFTTNPDHANFDAETAREGEIAAAEENQKIINFCKNADIVIHDAQYTEEEYSGKQGWGHTSYEDAVRLSESASVKKIAFYHHEPSRTDSQLFELEEKYKKDASAEVMMAKEGVVLEA
jgi:ribonuclease BN (tRNA processing enzyme)